MLIKIANTKILLIGAIFAVDRNKFIVQIVRFDAQIT